MKVWIQAAYGRYRAMLSIGNQTWYIGDWSNEVWVPKALATMLADALRLVPASRVVSFHSIPSEEEPK
jgi:hypothetical protein